MRHPLSIKFKLTLWYLLFLLVVLLFFSLISYLLLARNVYHTSQNNINIITFNLKYTGSALNEPVNGNQTDSSDQTYLPLFAFNLDQNQVHQIQSQTTALLPVSTPQGVLTIDEKSFITPDMKEAQGIWLYYRQAMDQPGSYEILAITQSRSEVINLIGEFKGVLIISIPLTLVVAGGLGYLLVRRMLKPIEEITQTAHEIQSRDLSRRIEIKNNDELGKLSATLNQAFEHLQKSLERQRQFTNDASHELQTPLAIVKGEATLALTQERSKEEYQKALESISQEITHIFSIVSKLLTLARADSGTEQLNLADINLKTFLEDIAADIQVLSERKQLTFQADLPENLVIKGDEVQLRELFLNLLDNAIKFTPSGGKISFSLDRQNEIAKVTVRDTGIGISKEHLPYIFERFYRVNRTHAENDEGSGLGLAICQHIVETHGGQIEVKSQVGEGSTFTVILPLGKN
jgi:heavy metal sensor kinase